METNTKTTELAAAPIVPAGTSPFDAFRLIRPDGSEYWSARDLMPVLGYEQWRRFEDSIDRAKAACKNSGASGKNHFAASGKMVDIGSGAQREAADFHLSRYGAYLVAMNGDPRKPEIAAAQTYFAIKTREAEIKPDIPQSLPEALRAYAAELEARTQLEHKVGELTPKAAFADRVADQTDCQNVNEVAKVIGTGSGRLWKWLKEQKIAFKNGRSNAAYQEYIDRGYFRQVQGTYKDGNGEEHAYTKMLVTGKGLVWLQRKWDEMRGGGKATPA